MGFPKTTSQQQDTFAARIHEELERVNGAESASGAPGGPAKEAEPTTAPVGEGERVVRAGDCISSIARDTGHFWETLWNEPANSELREARQDPNVLLQGDRVAVPELREKAEPGRTEMRHRFVRRGEPAKVKLQLKYAGEPRANEKYVLEVDGRTFEDVTDAYGRLEAPIPGNARHGELTVGEGSRKKVYPLNLGKLDPVESNAGLKARLNNLGFGCGELSDEINAKARKAIVRFQKKRGVEESGEPDAATRQKLKEVHGY